MLGIRCRLLEVSWRTGRTSSEHYPEGLIDADELFDSLDDLEIDVLIDDDGEPTLLDAEGHPIETWREGYPYDTRMTRLEYERTKRLLQIELLKLQSWVKEEGRRLILVFEGRDAAGKGGTIRRYTEHLNPRGARVVALEKPTDRSARPVVLPALRRAAAVGRRDRVLRPLLVQPRGRRAGHGLLRRGAVPAVHGPGAAVREDAGRGRHRPDQVLVLGHPERAADPVHAAPGRPGQAVEAQPDGSRVAGQVGRLHRWRRSRCSARPTPPSRPGPW